MGMRRIYRTKVDAAHNIPGHVTCGETHGHTYKIEVTLSSVPDYEFVDFHDIAKFCDCIINDFDHRNISEPTVSKNGDNCLKRLPAIHTAEQFAEYLHEELYIAWVEYLKNMHPDKDHAAAVKVQVFETSKFGVEFS